MAPCNEVFDTDLLQREDGMSTACDADVPVFEKDLAAQFAIVVGQDADIEVHLCFSQWLYVLIGSRSKPKTNIRCCI